MKPSRPGPMVLLYPKWIPGEHGPSGTIEAVTGLSISAGGRPLPWRRDLEDMFALHVEVPAGVQAIDLSFEYLSPGARRNFTAGISATPVLTMLEWNQVIFYPAGAPVRRLSVAPSVRLPEGWGWASALEPERSDSGELRFAATNIETLVDSPLLTGRHFRQIELSKDPAAVRLDLFADRQENLAATEEQLRQHRRLVSEALALFGARHYRHYDFLFVLSDATDHFGLEHHQSSDDRGGADYFTDPDAYLAGTSLLSHEYVHSWNGKFRRPAGLLTPDFNVPMKGDLLWVYEGLTEYWGDVLAVRAGLRTPEQFLESIANTASEMQFTPGRSWRPLQDTADEAQVLYNIPGAWKNWRRGVDYYPEGVLLWLDIDTLLRDRSHGERSLDDFARLFFGGDNGSFDPKGYDFDDVVSALEQVQRYDWAGFLRSRLDGKETGAPLSGLSRGGWKLAYSDEPNTMFRAQEKVERDLNLRSSLGIDVAAEEAPRVGDEGLGTVLDVIWNSPAFAAGLAPGMKIVAVNGTKFAPDLLKDAIRAASGASGAQIELLVQDFDQFRTVRVEYHGGLRYPHLVRIRDAEDRLGAIGRPLTKG